MLKLSDLPAREQREIHERREALNAAMVTQTRYTRPVAAAKPATSAATGSSSVADKPTSDAEIWAQSSERLKRNETARESLASNITSTLHPDWAKSNAKLKATQGDQHGRL